MRTTEHTMEWTAEIEGEDIDVLLYYSYYPGSPEYIPPYNRPDLYDPGAGADIDITKIERLDNADVIILDTDQHQRAISFIDEMHDELNGVDDRVEEDWRNEWR